MKTFLSGRMACALISACPGSYAAATALSDVAAPMQPGQWAQVSTQNFNAALLDDGASYDALYFSEDMTWDPVSRQLLFVGGGHASDAEFLRYNEATNTWQRSKPTGGFWHSNFSHAYDHNAIIPSLGKFFFRQPAYDPSDRIEIFDIPTQVWSRSATMPMRPGCCGGLEYFPELNGLVLVNGDQGVLLYNVGSNSWSTLSNSGWGDYHNFAEYSPVHKVLIFGGGESSGTTTLYRLDADRNIVRLNNAPAHLGQTHSIVTVDPNSGNFLVFFNNGSFYELDPMTDTWRRQSAGGPWGGSVFGTVATPISTYGVTLFAHYGGSDANAKVWLYKHSPGSGVSMPTVSIAASPTVVATNGTTTLTWSSTDATNCTASGAWSGSKGTSGSEMSAPIAVNATFTLTCTGTGGSTTRSAAVTLASGTPPPTINFSASPGTVAAGGSSTLSWTTTNATSCTGSGGAGGWAGSKSVPNGSQNISITGSTTFTLQCAGAGGSTTRTATVNVTGAPIVTFSASPTSLAIGETTMLTWNAASASGCTASGAWAGNKPSSGSERSVALNGSSTFDLSCTGAGGTTGQSVSVTVTGGGGGGGGGDPAAASDGGGGAVDPLLLVLGLLAAAVQRYGRARVRGRALTAAAALALGAGVANAADVTTVTVVSSSSTARTNVPVTFGHVFKQGDVLSGAQIGATAAGSPVALQVDKKATHADGSLRHAVVTAIVPALAANGTQTLTLNNSGSAPAGNAITTAQLLATTFDVTMNLDIGGTVYSASARSLLQSGTPGTWLSGPVATEWLVSGPVRTSGGAAHPHLQARFHVRAYQGLETVRVEAVLENVWAYETGPRNYTYNVTVDVAGGGTQYTQSNVTHYRQSRWRRIVWWGTNPQVAVRHNSAYLQATRAVPTYDPRVTFASSAAADWQAGLGTNPGVMSIGDLEPNMPQPAGRFEIAPLPAFQAGYIISQNDTARRVTIGYGEQAGAWPMHYRDKNTDQPISIDTFPNATIIGGSGIFGNFPACGGTCTTPLTPEASHHPTLAYVPYLITGDYYLMEEMVFWGNWVLFYGEASRHGGAQGLVVWDQVRGQAWALRTLAQAAYAAPDNHPLKASLVEKLGNNITYFRNNWVDSNPLGYITNTGAANWLGFPGILSTWMDDFLTWTFGHIVGLGFSDAQPVLAWKAKFAVGRLTNSGMCWKLASTNWVYATHRGYGGDTNNGTFITDWTDWRRNVVYGWDESLRGTNGIGGQEGTLFNATCGSSQMNSILGIGSGEMIGWDGTGAYPANIQAAAAVAVEAGVPNAQQAFDVLTSRGAYPLSGYGSEPQWALYPATAAANLPVVQISANPTAVTSGQTSTLTWSASNTNSCTASGSWAGSKAVSGTEVTPAITATRNYVLTCTNASGTNSASTTVNLLSATSPTLTFSASPTTVSSGASSTLTWSSTNTTSCTASGGWSGTKATSGSQTISNITATATYTLVCSGAGGNSPTRNATVTVGSGAAPTVDLTASAASVASGATTTLTWTTMNATTCTASGGWTGTKSPSGSETSAPLTANTTFTLTCSGAGGSGTDSVSVSVGASGGGATPPAGDDGGGGAFEWLSLLLLAIGAAARRFKHTPLALAVR